MKTILTACALITLLCATGWASGGGSGGGTSAAAGFIRFDPPQAQGCVAVRIAVPEDKMVAGIRWYNGSSSEAFPRVLAATGAQMVPPPCSEAVVLVENVQGQESEWSSVTFATPIASESGTLFIVMEYPADYAPPTSGAALGIGWAQEASPFPHFVSGDGQSWTPIASRCRALLEPLLTDRLPGVMSLRGPDEVQEPVAVEARLGLFTAPNPFNPQTKIELSLPAATTGNLRVYDIRGRLVAELYRGTLDKGMNVFTWDGRDGHGRQVASGPYWVQARTADQSLTKKVMLLK